MRQSLHTHFEASVHSMLENSTRFVLVTRTLNYCTTARFKQSRHVMHMIVQAFDTAAHHVICYSCLIRFGPQWSMHLHLLLTVDWQHVPLRCSTTATTTTNDGASP